MKRAELQKYAQLGAKAQMSEHLTAMQTIFGAFPDLKASALASLGGTNGFHPPAANGEADPAPVRKRRKMSAAARKAISLRMKARWAERNAKKKPGRPRKNAPAQPSA
jgi:hypothetical protein